MKPRLAFLGTPEISAIYLRALCERGFEVNVTMTRPDKRRGRGTSLSPSPVKAASIERAIPVVHSYDELTGYGFDLAIVVAFGRIIPKRILDIAPFVNVHYSLLPRWRGAAPMERAILAGDTLSGVCLMEVAEELDAGVVYDRREVAIMGLYLDAVTSELTRVGVGMLLENLAGGLEFLRGGEPQRGDVTYASKIDSSELEITPSMDVRAAMGRVHLGRAYVVVRGRRVRIERATPSERTHTVQRDPTRVASIVATSGDPELQLEDGSIDLQVVRPEGRGSMVAADYVRGQIRSYADGRIPFGDGGS